MSFAWVIPAKAGISVCDGATKKQRFPLRGNDPVGVKD